jgi:hypothetical protein
MEAEVVDALCEWIAALAVGVAPLVAHLAAQIAMKPSARIDGNWAVDWCFLAIATCSGSIISVVARLRKGASEIVKGRAAPVLIGANTLFLVAGAVIYAIVATGNGADTVPFLAAGLFIGGGILSLYLELSIAARLARRL